MKLDNIKISRFRSIKSASMDINSINAIVGSNNAGKSAILRALNCFFNYREERDSFISGEHHYSNRSVPRIQITFKDIPNDKRIKKMQDGDKLVLEMRFLKQNNRREYRYKIGKKYYVPDRFRIGIISRYVKYVFIPPDRDRSKFQWDQDSLLREIVLLYLDQKTEKRDSYSASFRDAAANLQRFGLNKLSKELKKYYILGDGVTIDVSFEKELTFRNFLNSIFLKATEHENSFRVGHCGNGVQSLSVIAMHFLLSQLKGSNVIIGLEEPETNLHPQAQIELIGALKQNVEEMGQFLFTTHSSTMLDHIDHENVLLVKKTHDDTRGFCSTVEQLEENFFARNKIEELKYYQFHKYRNSDFFFSKQVVLVESTVDAQAISVIANRQKKNLDLSGNTVLNLDGVGNIRYPFYLLKELKVPFWVIVDKDFFMPYLNDSLKNSRDNRGMPKYRYEYKTENLDIIKQLIPKESERSKLLDLFKRNHSEAMNLLYKYNVICMNYNLEVDLVCSTNAEKLYYEKLRVGQHKRTITELTINRKDQIKEPKYLLKVLEELPATNFPNSFKKIRKFIKEELFKKVS